MLQMFFFILLPIYSSNQHYTNLIERKPLSDVQRWAIGASNVLAEGGYMKFDSLAGFEINKITTQPWAKSLREQWSINNRQDLLNDLKWVNEEGHSEEFEETKEVIYHIENEFGPTIVRVDFENRIKSDWEYKYKILIAAKYGDYLGDKSLRGWDISRYICLCRWGYAMGYLTEQEAWERIMPAARELQQIFDSWEDLGMNYLIGREFWSPFSRTAYRYDEAYLRLLEMPDSPWQLPWNLPLDEEN